MPDALQMLRDDHKHVKDIFKQFEECDDSRQKRQLVQAAIHKLRIHTQLEEQILFPAMRKGAGIDGIDIDVSHEEHHVAEMLIDELAAYRSTPAMDAKFLVLADGVRHHIDDEEADILPQAAELGRKRIDELGEEMEKLRARLEQVMAGSGRTTARSGAGHTRSRAAATRGRTAARATRSTAGRSTTARSTASRSSGAKPGTARRRSPAKAMAGAAHRGPARGKTPARRPRKMSAAPTRSRG